MKKRMITFILTAVLLYTVLLAFLYAYQRTLMYFPDTARVTPGQLNMQAEIIAVETKDGLVLEGWYFPPGDVNKPVILWFHGNASSHGHRSYRLSEYLEAGYGALLAGYRGYGGNPGKPSEEGLYQDARAYISWLKNSGQDIVLYGESLGTGVAVQMATEFDSVKALILEAPYTSIADIAKRQYFFVPVDLMIKDQYRSIDKIADIHMPVFILHGGADILIPASHARALYKVAQEPKMLKIIDDAEHYNLYDQGAGLHVLKFLSTIEAE